MAIPQQRLHDQLVAAGIPVEGVSGEGASVRLDFTAAATAQQRQQAQQLAAAFDWTPRRARAHAAVYAQVASLGDAPFRQLAAHLLADYILANPDWATALGVNIPGDEPDTP